MSLPSHTYTRGMPLQKRLELARNDAASGRMTALEAVELAAELLKGVADLEAEVRELQSQEDDIVMAREEAAEARAEVDDLESRAARERNELRRALTKINTLAPDLKVRKVTDDLRKEFAL